MEQEFTGTVLDKTGRTGWTVSRVSHNVLLRYVFSE